MLKLVVVIALFVSFSSSSLADFVASVSATTNKQSDGSYLYSYIVTNNINSTFSINNFNLVVRATANPFSPTEPTGWVFSSIVLPNQSYDFISWETPQNTFSPINPGASGVFSFKSALAPAISSYSLDGSDVGDPFSGDEISGSVLGPGISTVPEPTSMILFGTGVVTLAGYLVYRGKRPQ